MKKIIVLVLSTLTVTGCASYGNWSPTVDSYGDRRAQYISQDQSQCKQLALQASGGTAKQTITGAGVGALLGAAAGSIAGAFIGNPAVGAGIGAASGGFLGANGMGFNAEVKFKSAYNSCMRNRGHNVIS